MGWEPSETHTYVYDDAGRVVSVTVVREPEWDDESRGEFLALAQYEAGICSCGLHESVTADPSNLFTFETRTCPVCAGSDRWMRKVAADDDDARPGREAPPETAHPDDGRRLFLRAVGPDEASGRRSRGHQVAHNKPQADQPQNDPDERVRAADQQAAHQNANAEKQDGEGRTHVSTHAQTVTREAVSRGGSQ